MYSVVEPSKLADVKIVADKLAGLPKEVLLYIVGYAEGYRDKLQDDKIEKQEDPPEKDSA